MWCLFTYYCLSTTFAHTVHHARHHARARDERLAYMYVTIPGHQNEKDKKKHGLGLDIAAMRDKCEILRKRISEEEKAESLRTVEVARSMVDS